MGRLSLGATGVTSILVGALEWKNGFVNQDLDPSGGIVVETIYELFRARGTWPTFAVVDRGLDRRHGLDAHAQLASLPRRYFRRSRLNGPFLSQDEVRLTLTGVAECPESQDDLERLVQFVLWLAERERQHDPDETGGAAGGDERRSGSRAAAGRG